LDPQVALGLVSVAAAAIQTKGVTFPVSPTRLDPNQQIDQQPSINPPSTL
jgi:hypothetical protein